MQQPTSTWAPPSWLKWAIGIGLAVIFGIFVAFSGSDSPTTQAPARPGNPAVYERIASETDCITLVDEIETAQANINRDTASGHTAAAEVDTAYWFAALSRFSEIGCHR